MSSVTTAGVERSHLTAPRTAPPPAPPTAPLRNAGETVGVRVYAASAVALGLVGLVSGDFAGVWHPVPAELPGRTALAYVTAVALVASGVGLLRRRTAVASAVVLAALYFVFAVLWVPRVVMHPRILGTWNGAFEQLALVAAALTYVAILAGPGPRAALLRRAARVVFGVCLLSFGATHFDALQVTADMVPKWLPPSPRFWAASTGVFHIAAGVSILSGVLSTLAARLFTAMLVGFGALVWAPMLVANPHAHMVWAGNAVNFALVGAAWLMADAISLESSRRP